VILNGELPLRITVMLTLVSKEGVSNVTTGLQIDAVYDANHDGSYGAQHGATFLRNFVSDLGTYPRES